MKLTLLKQLTLGYVAILLLVILLGFYVALKLNQLNQLIRGTAVDGTSMTQLNQLQDTLFSQVSFEKKFLISNDPDFKVQFWEIEDRFRNEFRNSAHLASDERKQVLLAEIDQLYQGYIDLFKQEAVRIEKEKNGPGRAYSRENEAILDGITQRMQSVIEMVRSDREDKIMLASRISERVMYMTIFTAILTVAVGTIISFFNTRRINQSILMLKRNTKEIAKGRYVQIPDIVGPQEIAELADDFNRMSIRLKELDELKLDFINHVSHELRTPLTAIKEASEMLLEDTFSDSPEKQLQLLTITREECERLIGSVNRILDFSRMEARMMEYRYQQSSLAPVLQRTVLKLAPLAKRKGIHLELRPIPDLPQVRIDEERIGQVVENLIGNALKFTRENGKVIVRTSPFERDRQFVCIAVSDNGVGISENDLSSVFDKFSRIETNGLKAAGSGLGLTISKHIIADHGGEIWAKSIPGKGSTFYFALPAA